MLPLVIANCFRNLAIASGQGKKALDLEDKVEDLNEMKPPALFSAFLAAPSAEYQQAFLEEAITYE